MQIGIINTEMEVLSFLLSFLSFKFSFSLRRATEKRCFDGLSRRELQWTNDCFQGVICFHAQKVNINLVVIVMFQVV